MMKRKIIACSAFLLLVIIAIQYFWQVRPVSIKKIHLDTLYQVQNITTTHQLNDISIRPSTPKKSLPTYLHPLIESVDTIGADRLLFIRRYQSHSYTLRFFFYRPLSFLGAGAWSIYYTSDGYTEEEQVPKITKKVLDNHSVPQNVCEPSDRPLWFICFNRHD